MMSVTVLGTGLMGSGMARSLVRAGARVTAWNRDGAKAKPLADCGITVVEDLAAAVAGAQVVLTMLFDGDAVGQVMSAVLPHLEPDAVWVQSGTIGLPATETCAQLAARHGVGFVDAPVLGTRQPAEDGVLTVLVGGPPALRDRVAPVFDAIGSRTIWVGERPGDGHRLKLAANAWVLTITAATAQSVGLAGDLGLDPAMFLEAIAGGPLDCGYAQRKGKAMIDEEFPPAFALDGAVKDSSLIAETMRDTGTDHRVMSAVHEQFRRAADAGYTDLDMAAVVRAVRAAHIGRAARADHAEEPGRPRHADRQRGAGTAEGMQEQWEIANDARSRNTGTGR